VIGGLKSLFAYRLGRKVDFVVTHDHKQLNAVIAIARQQGRGRKAGLYFFCHEGLY
jgi:hypothetical protein